MGKRKLSEFRQDSDYIVTRSHREGGRLVIDYRCPIHLRWCGIKERVGDGAFSRRQSSLSNYSEADVCEEWLSFMGFREWVLSQPDNWESLQLDKDLTKHGNKMYCPEYCAFVPSKINSLLLKGNREGCTLPIGVSKISDKRRTERHLYVGQIAKVDGGKKKIQTSTASEAHQIWQEGRELLIRAAVLDWTSDVSYNHKIASNLLAVADKLLYNRLEGVETFDLSF